MPKVRTVIRTVVGRVVLGPLLFVLGSTARRPGSRSGSACASLFGKTRGVMLPVYRDPKPQNRHPLDPLDPDEIRLAVDTVPKDRQLAATVRFVTVSLNEPKKSHILQPGAGDSLAREAFLVLLDSATGTGYEAVVNLGRGPCLGSMHSKRACSRRSCSTSSASARRRPGSAPHSATP